MALRTSIATGLFSAGGTWDTGVPAPGDTFLVAGAHTVTVDSAEACDGGNVDGILELQSSNSLDIQVSALICNAGGTIKSISTSVGGYFTITFPSGGGINFSITGNVELQYVSIVGANSLRLNSGSAGFVRYCQIIDRSSSGTELGIINYLGTSTVEVTDFMSNPDMANYAAIYQSGADVPLLRSQNIWHPGPQTVRVPNTGTTYNGYGSADINIASDSNSGHVDGYKNRAGVHVKGDAYTIPSTRRHILSMDTFPFAQHSSSVYNHSMLSSGGITGKENGNKQLVRRGITTDGNAIVSRWGQVGIDCVGGHYFNAERRGGTYLAFKTSTTQLDFIRVISDGGSAEIFTGSDSGTSGTFSSAADSILHLKTRFQTRSGNNYIDAVIWKDGEIEPAFGAGISDPSSNDTHTKDITSTTIVYSYRSAATPTAPVTDAAAWTMPGRTDTHYIGAYIGSLTGDELQRFEYWNVDYASAASTGQDNPLFRFDEQAVYRQWSSDSSVSTVPTTEATSFSSDSDPVWQYDLGGINIGNPGRGFVWNTKRQYTNVMTAARCVTNIAGMAILLAWDLDNLTGYRLRMVSSTEIAWEKFDGASWTPIGGTSGLTAMADGDWLIAEINAGTLQAYRIPDGGDMSNISTYGTSQADDDYTVGYAGFNSTTGSGGRVSHFAIMTVPGQEHWYEIADLAYAGTGVNGPVNLTGGDLNVHGGLVTAFNESTGSRIRVTSAASTVRTVDTTETSRVLMKSKATNPFVPTSGQGVGLIDIVGGTWELEHLDGLGVDLSFGGTTTLSGYIRHCNFISAVAATSFGILRLRSTLLDVRDCLLYPTNATTTIFFDGGSGGTVIYRDIQMLAITAAHADWRADQFGGTNAVFMSSSPGGIEQGSKTDRWVKSFWHADTMDLVEYGDGPDSSNVLFQNTLAYYGFRWTAASGSWKLDSGLLKASLAGIIRGRPTLIREVDLHVAYVKSSGITVDIEWYDEDFSLLSTANVASSGTLMTRPATARYFRMKVTAAASGDTLDAVKCRDTSGTGQVLWNDNFNLSFTEYGAGHAPANSMEMSSNFATGQVTDGQAIAEDLTVPDSYEVRAIHGTGESGLFAMVKNVEGVNRGYLLKNDSGTWKLYDYNLDTGSGTVIYTGLSVTAGLQFGIRVMDKGDGTTRIWIQQNGGSFAEITPSLSSNPNYIGGQPGMLLNSTIGDFEVTSMPGCDIYWSGKIFPDEKVTMDRVIVPSEVHGSLVAGATQTVELEFPTITQPAISGGELRGWCPGSALVAVNPTSTSVTIAYTRYCTLHIGIEGDAPGTHVVDWQRHFATETDPAKLFVNNGALVMHGTTWKGWPAATWPHDGFLSIFDSNGNHRDDAAGLMARLDRPIESFHFKIADWHIVPRFRAEGRGNDFASCGAAFHDPSSGKTILLPIGVENYDLGEDAEFSRVDAMNSSNSQSRGKNLVDMDLALQGSISLEDSYILTPMRKMRMKPILFGSHADFMYFDLTIFRRSRPSTEKEVKYQIGGDEVGC